MEQLSGRLVAVVVTYNRLPALKVTLDRLLASDPEHLERVVVVDNASTDGTKDWLIGSDDPRLEVLHQSQNIGGAGGFEVGLRHAVAAHDPDWLVVMDDDARPAEGALAAFHSTARGGADGWAAAVYQPDGQICDINRPSINPFWHRDVLWRTVRGMVTGQGRDGFHLGPTAYTAADTRAIDATSFVGFFVSRHGVELAGYPDGKLFIYGDDVLYTLGLTSAGGCIRFDPTVRFEHDYTSQSDDDKRFRPLWKCYFRYRNLMMVYRLCSGFWFVFVLPMITAKWLLLARHYRGDRMTYIKLALRAVWDGALGRTNAALNQVKVWSKEIE